MLIQGLNRTDPEKVLVTFTNSDGSQLTNGQVLMWDTAGTAGVSAKLSGTTNSPYVAGVVVATVDTGAVGVCQVYGYHSAVLTTTTVTASTLSVVGADTSGKCVNFTSTTTSVGASAAAQLHGVIGPVWTAPTASTSAAVFIRLM